MTYSGDSDWIVVGSRATKKRVTWDWVLFSLIERVMEDYKNLPRECPSLQLKTSGLAVREMTIERERAIRSSSEGWGGGHEWNRGLLKIVRRWLTNNHNIIILWSRPVRYSNRGFSVLSFLYAHNRVTLQLCLSLLPVWALLDGFRGNYCYVFFVET